MSVPSCRHCDRTYWRFRRDHPPPGYCSLTCKEIHADAKPKSAAQPDEPRIWLNRIRDHNRLIHNAESDMIQWDCKACEKLQEGYAASLAFHSKFAPEAGNSSGA